MRHRNKERYTAETGASSARHEYKFTKLRVKVVVEVEVFDGATSRDGADKEEAERRRGPGDETEWGSQRIGVYDAG